VGIKILKSRKLQATTENNYSKRNGAWSSTTTEETENFKIKINLNTSVYFNTSCPITT
jgi:hypothetical protein